MLKIVPIFCNYCKKDGYIIKECPTRSSKRSKTTYTISIGSSNTSSYVDTTHLKKSTHAPTQSVTPEMIQQMIIFAFSAL